MSLCNRRFALGQMPLLSQGLWKIDEITQKKADQWKQNNFQRQQPSRWMKGDEILVLDRFLIRKED